MFSLMKIFDKKAEVSKDEIAAFLKTEPEALEMFEKAYNAYSIAAGSPDNLFKINSRQVSEMTAGIELNAPEGLEDIKRRIVNELIAKTVTYDYKDKKSQVIDLRKEIPDEELVTREEIMKIPEPYRPAFTGSLMKIDIPGSGRQLLSILKECMEQKNPLKQKKLYQIFRQGLDILDLDAIVYEIIDKNVNSMGYWLPHMVEIIDEEGFFKIPNTRIIKVPLTLLQLTRQDYMSLTRSTLDIVDEYCRKVFDLKDDKEYFIKTGTYSSKYDFRNAKVAGAKEIRELGEYLLFIHWQALQMAHYDLTGRNQPVIYGVSTTTEWVVREYIKDTEHNPCIYHGMPLHTEYRVFVDFDTDTILGIHPYWDKGVMKKHFERVDDADARHDYITYSLAEDQLYNRYFKNKDTVMEHIKALLPKVDMQGQWSIDIMQNGNDFYFIDMAVAENSAFFREAVPLESRKPMKENWIPDLSDKKERNYFFDKSKNTISDLSIR